MGLLDIDHPDRGIRECPRCCFTMEMLRRSPVLWQYEAYLLDRGRGLFNTGWDQDDHIISSLLIGNVLRYFWRQFVDPVAPLVWGSLRRLRFRRILRRHPDTLRCPHCGLLIRRRYRAYRSAPGFQLRPDGVTTQR